MRKEASIANWSGRHRKSHLDGRAREVKKEIRGQGGNTKVETLRKIYGADFGREVRGDAKLDTLLRRVGSKSLNDYLKQRTNDSIDHSHPSSIGAMQESTRSLSRYAGVIRLREDPLQYQIRIRREWS